MSVSDYVSLIENASYCALFPTGKEKQNTECELSNKTKGKAMVFSILLTLLCIFAIYSWAGCNC